MKGGYKFCPGINPDMYKTKYHDVIRYDPKKLRRTVHPVQRIDSGKCKLWHKLLEKDNMTDVMCSGCKCLINELNQRLKKVQNTTSEQKQHHVNASSRFPEKYLSPKSLKKKRQNMQQERTALLKNYTHTEISLSEDQHDQMCDIVDKVSNAKELESMFTDGDNHGVGLALRELWKSDLQNVKKELEGDQQKNGILSTYIIINAHYNYIIHAPCIMQ